MIKLLAAHVQAAMCLVDLPKQSAVEMVVHVSYRFDLPRFYAEAHRVLRPGGTLAALAAGTRDSTRPAISTFALTLHRLRRRDGAIRAGPVR